MDSSTGLVASFVVGCGLTGYILLDSTHQALTERDDAQKELEHTKQKVNRLKLQIMELETICKSREAAKVYNRSK